jgi:hypothetical protein
MGRFACEQGVFFGEVSGGRKFGGGPIRKERRVDSHDSTSLRGRKLWLRANVVGVEASQTR